MAIKRLTAPSILLVEDNPLHVRLVTSMLTEVWPGFEDLYQARRLDSALERLEQSTPDCVLLDLVLPDADGLEAVNVMLAASPEVPIVVLSSHDDGDLALRAVDEGAQDYLVKGSVDAWELARSIRFAIHRHKNRIDASSGGVDPFPMQRVTAESVTASGETDLGMAIVDTTRVFRHATDGLARLLERPLYEIIGVSVEDLIDPDDIGGWRLAIERVSAESGQQASLALTAQTESGSVSLDASVVALCGADGEMDAMLVTYRPAIESAAAEVSSATYVAMSDFNG